MQDQLDPGRSSADLDRRGRFQVVPDCTCEAAAGDRRHEAECAVAMAGLDVSPRPTAEQLETLATAVLALNSRFLAPHGKRQLINATQRETIRQAVRYAEELLRDEEE